MVQKITLEYEKNHRCIYRLLHKWNYTMIRPAGKFFWAIVLILCCLAVYGAELPSKTFGKCLAYDVLINRHSSTYHTRTYKALLFTNGTFHRIIFYWLDPALNCELTDNLAFSDFLFYPDRVLFWHYRDRSHIHTLPFGSSRESNPWQLPKNNTLESILQSIFSAVIHNMSIPKNIDDSTEINLFFKRSRKYGQFEHAVEPPSLQDITELQNSISRLNNIKIFNQLPHGRTYRKQIECNNAVVWSIDKEAPVKDVLRIVVRPKYYSFNPQESDEIFDPNKLGQCSIIPEPYRQYWSFKQQLENLKSSTLNVPDAKRLYDDIESYLKGSNLPKDVDLALKKLCFTVSLETDSSDYMFSSASSYFTAYLHTSQESVDKIIIELGRIAEKLRKHWSDNQIHDFILPRLMPLICPEVFADRGFINNAILKQIKIFGWFWYGQVILESIKNSGCIESQVMEELYEEIGTYNPPISKNITPDSNELTPSMVSFLKYTEAKPPKGQLTFEELNYLIEQAVKESYSSDDRGNVQDFCIRLRNNINALIGNGPFAGDAMKLRGTVSALNKRYLSSNISVDERSAALATFIALSFYDTSTQEDHNLLTSQLKKASNMLHKEVSQILGSYNLDENMDIDKIEQIFNNNYENITEIVNDPLWPMFKFPLSKKENAMLVNQLMLNMRNVNRAAKILSNHLNKGTDSSLAKLSLESQIDYAVQKILAIVIKLRSPRAQVRIMGGKHRIPIIIIQEPNYQDLENFSQMINKMKYFYLGHRTQYN